MRDVSKFLSGFRRFQHNYLGARRGYYDRLVREGQHPRALVIACCDSRCDPALLMDCDPGDMFVVRNVANLVPPHTQAGSFAGTTSAIAFAIRNLEVEHVIIMGHAQCGGIRALMDHQPPSCNEDELISKWLSIAEDAKNKVVQNFPDRSVEFQTQACEQAAILVSLENLMTFPWIRFRVESGGLQLHGWYFDMVNGELQQYEPDSGKFHALVANRDIGKSTSHLWCKSPG